MASPAHDARSRLPLFLATALTACLAWPVSSLASSYRDLSLEEALTLLESGGLSILYSSDLIEPWMRVGNEPSAKDPTAILEEILAPYGLTAVPGPNGSVMVVRAAVSAATGRVAGTLQRIEDGSPVSGVILRLAGEGPEVATGAGGWFEFPALAPGRYRIEIRHELLHLADDYVAEVRPGKTTELRLAAFDLSAPNIEEIIVSASQYQLLRSPAPPMTSLTTADLENIPDISDDPLRAVARLPGTASGHFTAKTNVRGGEVDETLVRFDDLRLYNPFHLKDFQSLFSAIDPAVISRMNVYTGGFPVPFSDRMSSVVDIQPVPPPEQAAREIGLSFFNASALASGRFNDGNSNYLLAARRGNLDWIFEVVDPNLGDPTYVDVYARAGHRISESLSASGNVLVFDDNVYLSDSDQEEQARADYRDEYYWLRLDWQPAPDTSGSLLVARSELESERHGSVDQPGISRGTLEDERSFTIDSIQSDWSSRFTDRIQVQFGGDWRSMKGRYDYRDEVQFDVLFDTPGAPTEPTRTRQLSAHPDGEQYGTYANLRVEALADLTAEAGIRWDKETLTRDNDAQFSPRASLLYRLGEATRLRTSWGRFVQAQAINELQISDGVTDFFTPQRADHLVASIEHRRPGGLDVRVELFHKEYRDLRPRFENLLNTLIVVPELKPDRVLIAPDEATAKGAEFSLGRKDSGPLSWWLSYTLSSVEDDVAGADRRRSWDQTHFVSAGIGWRSDRWEFSVAGTYHTGWPTTEVELAETEPIPVATTGPVNEERLAFYRTIDARAARTFRLEEAGSVMVFFELTNVFNRTNDCCIEYGAESDEGPLELAIEPVDSLPIFPSLGFVWQF